ncbi:cytochrome c oxidase subunit II [Streptomyces montanisoli]|uniref:cytochrome-c oxidase n=1 Tax=Streptomyces montanisoli TaxID=2798581 RepID=A0A940M630_9ACTN|nr:cytochrome c oxidase subunit II [Streptomyces montanisoli]MBP0456840.1 cytochrome c oxidase subunit II [Streptomyces montanisoli]
MNQRHIFGTVFWLESAIAGGVFVVIAIILLVSLVRRRARVGLVASQRQDNRKLEISYAVVLAAFAAFLVSYTAWQNHRETGANASTAPAGHASSSAQGSGAPSKPVTVNVTAFQWCWQFGYPQAPGSLKVSDNCQGGKVPTLVVPTGREIRIHLTSKDVIHSMWVPALRYKMDAFPDHVNSFTIKIDKAGRWVGRCAEFCGERHSKMHFWLKAVPPDEYKHWVQQHAAHAGGAQA